MPPAILLGDRGCGTTTFLGLLYAALVRWGARSEDGFRVHASHGSIRALKDVYGSLMDGRFPQESVEYRRSDLSFVLGYGPAGSGWFLGNHRATELSLHVASLETFSDLQGHGFVSDTLLREELSSQVVLLLVDASRIPLDVEELPGGISHPWRRFDTMAASSLALLESFQRTERVRRRARLHPIFILTKMDRLSERLRSGTLGGLIPSPAARAARTLWGEDLLAKRLPRTWGVLEGGGHGVRFETPLWFASWVGVENGPQGEGRVRRRQTAAVGGWEPDYPHPEFEALLTELRRLADRVGDPLLAA